MDIKTIFKKFGCNFEDVVKIKTKNGIFEGILIPTLSKKNITLKIISGYNIGIGITEIISIEDMKESKRLGKPKAKELTKNPSLPTIAILQVGGTISSRVDYRTGVVEASFYPNDLITMYPELEKISNFRTRSVGTMYSGDMRFVHYTKLATAIEEEIKKGGIKGIILPHGTDTMTYTSAALAFMLKNLPIPVILVGAQRSTDRGSSDAAMNLICATEFIAKTDFSGIGICMHETSDDRYCNILTPTKSKKLHTSRRDAFKSVNDSPIARIDYLSRDIIFLNKKYQKADKKNKFIVRKKMEEKIAIMKPYPNLFPDIFDFYRKNKYKGLVIEGTGLGHLSVGVPDEDSKINAKNLEAVKKLVESGCIVVMASQCIFGSVQMRVYDYGIKLRKVGVISAKDMISETAFVKLAWLLGNFSKEKAVELIAHDLRGEIKEKVQMQCCTLMQTCKARHF